MAWMSAAVARARVVLAPNMVSLRFEAVVIFEPLAYRCGLDLATGSRRTAYDGKGL